MDEEEFGSRPDTTALEKNREWMRRPICVHPCPSVVSMLSPKKPRIHQSEAFVLENRNHGWTRMNTDGVGWEFEVHFLSARSAPSAVKSFPVKAPMKSLVVSSWCLTRE